MAKKKKRKKKRPSYRPILPGETNPGMYWDSDETKYLEDGHPCLYND
jgi:hypothetical protein